MALEIENSGPPLSEGDLASVERRLGFPLPAAYRAFVLKNNGGEPKPDLFEIKNFEGRDFDGVSYLFAIGHKIDSYELNWNYDVFKDRMPPGYLPIGCTGCGDILCIMVHGLGAEKVMLWDHENETVPPRYDNMYLVATTFDEFLESLHDRDLSAEIARLVAGARVIKKSN